MAHSFTNKCPTSLVRCAALNASDLVVTAPSIRRHLQHQSGLPIQDRMDIGLAVRCRRNEPVTLCLYGRHLVFDPRSK
mgnify:CR=1 FL=1